MARSSQRRMERADEPARFDRDEDVCAVLPPNRDQIATKTAQGRLFSAYVFSYVLLIGLGLAFGEVARAARRSVPDGLDVHALAWVLTHHTDWPGLDQMFRVLTLLGNYEVAIPSTLLVAGVLIWLGRHRIASLRKREAVFWLGVAVTGRLLCVLLKLWFQRARPPVEMRRLVIGDSSFSFPSGHATYAAIFFAMLAILVARAVPSRLWWVRGLGYTFCAVMAALVAASRVWLVVHYPTDVMGGLFLGVAWVIVAYLLRVGWRHWRHRQQLRRVQPA